MTSGGAPSQPAGPAKRRRILFLTPQLPHPPRQGTAIRNYNLIAQVAARHDVALLSFARDGQLDPGPLAQFCQPLVTVRVPVRPLPARLRTLLASSAPDMAHRLHSPAYASALRDTLASTSCDILQIEGIELAPYALLAREWLGERTPALVFDDHNAEYLLQKRAYQADIRHPRRWPAALYSLAQWRRLARFERHVCHVADAVLATSQADAQALRRLLPDLEPVIVPNGVDVARHHPDLPDSIPLEHPAVVFTGKMDYRPNVDAMLWFHGQVWPIVRAQSPKARLYVVGQSPHPRLSVLHRDPSTILTGYVDDILPYFGGADVYVAPLRIGGGTRLKVLEALAAGLPLVATQLGVEGIGLVPGEHAILADTPQAFAQAVLSLLRDPARGRTLGTAARRFVFAHYDWRQIALRLEPVYASLGR